jgi:hypothetical protein
MNIFVGAISRVKKGVERLLRSIIEGDLDQRLVSLARARFGCDVATEIADDVATLVDVGDARAYTVAVTEMRAHAANGKERTFKCRGLIDVGRVHLDELANHLQRAELFQGDVRLAARFQWAGLRHRRLGNGSTRESWEILPWAAIIDHRSTIIWRRLTFIS